MRIARDRTDERGSVSPRLALGRAASGEISTRRFSLVRNLPDATPSIGLWGLLTSNDRTSLCDEVRMRTPSFGSRGSVGGRNTVLGIGLALVLASGCGADDSLAGDMAAGHPTKVKMPTKAVAEPPSDDPIAVANAAPGYQPQAYPAGPYGLTEGSIIRNMEFLGWHQPATAQYALDATESVQLSDFYDPTGEKGTELILVNSVAVWCGVCRGEYDDLKNSDTYQSLHARGLEMLGLLFEDNNADPARYVDLINWSSAYDVSFPFALDPGFKSGVYFDRSATPMNMLIDAKTMQILVLMTGYNPQLYETASQLLTQRGR
jgi:hypothetical protein